MGSNKVLIVVFEVQLTSHDLMKSDFPSVKRKVFSSKISQLLFFKFSTRFSFSICLIFHVPLFSHLLHCEFHRGGVDVRMPSPPQPLAGAHPLFWQVLGDAWITSHCLCIYRSAFCTQTKSSESKCFCFSPPSALGDGS